MDEQQRQYFWDFVSLFWASPPEDRPSLLATLEGNPESRQVAEFFRSILAVAGPPPSEGPFGLRHHMYREGDTLLDVNPTLSSRVLRTLAALRWPPSPVQLSPEQKAWLKSQVNEDEILQTLRELRAGQGEEPEDLVADLEKAVKDSELPREP